MWAENALADLGRCLSKYRGTRDAAFLAEALNGAEALHAVIDTIILRETAGKN
jgi:hypothetical protein